MQKQQWFRMWTKIDITSRLAAFFDGILVFSFGYLVLHNTISHLTVRGASMSPLLNPHRPGRENAFWKKDVCLQRRYFPSFNDVPQRGDVVVAKNPVEYHSGVVKRIIGLPGDFVKTRGDIVEVQPGYVFLEGDNVNRSIDSNNYGPVPLNLIDVCNARAICVLIPRYFEWDRFLLPLSRKDKPERRTGKAEYEASQSLKKSRETGIQREALKMEVRQEVYHNLDLGPAIERQLMLLDLESGS